MDLRETLSEIWEKIPGERPEEKYGNLMKYAIVLIALIIAVNYISSGFDTFARAIGRKK